jgi:hypothetical protein
MSIEKTYKTRITRKEYKMSIEKTYKTMITEAKEPTAPDTNHESAVLGDAIAEAMMDALAKNFDKEMKAWEFQKGEIQWDKNWSNKGSEVTFKLKTLYGNKAVKFKVMVK